jgi:phosphoglycolate phosphatase-like HAD superfamily hydrolase
MVKIIAAGRQFDVSCIVLDKDGTLIDFEHTYGRRTADWIHALVKAVPGENSHAQLFANTIGYDWARQKVLPDGPIAIVTGSKLVTLAAGVLYQQGLPWHQAERVAILRQYSKHLAHQSKRPKSGPSVMCLEQLIG